MSMTAEDVLYVLDLLDEAEIDYWLGGGWGIDALVGQQTRSHDDLDLAFPSEQEEKLIQVLKLEGFAITSDWRPVKFVMRDERHRSVDAHPVTFDDGVGWQANVGELSPFPYPREQFTTGKIDGRSVPCISIERQVDFHDHYEPTEKDRADMQVLAGRFGAKLPEWYRRR